MDHSDPAVLSSRHISWNEANGLKKNSLGFYFPKSFWNEPPVLGEMTDGPWP